MDPFSALTTALIGAGPFGLCAAIFLFLYIREDRRNEELTDKIITLATSTTSTMKDLTTAVDAALRERRP